MVHNHVDATHAFAHVRHHRPAPASRPRTRVGSLPRADPRERSRAAA